MLGREIRAGRRRERKSCRVIAFPGLLRFQKDYPANVLKIVHGICDRVRGHSHVSTVSPNETGAPATAGSSGQRASTRSRRDFFQSRPLRPGQNGIVQKRLGISVLGVLKDKCQREGVSYERKSCFTLENA